MREGIIYIKSTKPPLKTRVKWYLLQAKLRALEPFVKPLTADEWYVANCPPYAGQRRPWGRP